MWSASLSTPGATGRSAFEGLIVTSFLLCCAACLLTADTISRERREGTLILLLLTRVRGLDVLLGKFASGGLACLLALVALVPVLALPLLGGGVTGAEAARMAVALFNTMFLALSIGLWASARGFERFRTTRAALLVTAGMVLGPLILRRFLPAPYPALASPLGAMFQAADLRYSTSPEWYWLSLALVHTFAWAFLLAAAAFLRSRSREIENDSSAGATRSGAQRANGANASQCRYCGRQNPADAIHCYECGTELHPKQLPRSDAFKLTSEPTPLHWLLRRQRGLKPLLWFAAFIGFWNCVLYGIGGRFFAWGSGSFIIGVSWAFSLVTTALTGSIFAWVASRFFIEARRTGEVELLLTTPVGAEQTVAAQWDTLKRLVRWPVLAMLMPSLLQVLALSWIGYPQGAWRLSYALSLLLGTADTLLGIGACLWLAMWLAMRGLSQGRTILWTVLLAKGVPYLFGVAWWMLSQFLVARVLGAGNPPSSLPLLLGSVLPQLAMLVFYLFLIHSVRSQLLHDPAGSDRFNPRHMIARFIPGLAVAIRRFRQWPPV
jgi:hypothetical protein